MLDSGPLFPFQYELFAGCFFLSIYVCEKVAEHGAKTSPLLGQIVAGFVLGPAVLNVVPYEAAFRFIGKLGVMLLVVDSGLQVDLSAIRRVGPRGCLAAVAGTVGPVGLALLFLTLGYGVDWRAALAVGSAIAPTSLGFSAKLLGADLASDLGQLIAIAAVVDDVLSLMLLALVKALRDEAGSGWSYGQPVVASFAAVGGGVVLAVLLPRVLVPLRGACKQTTPRQRARFNNVVLVVLAMLLSWACAAIGSSDLLGCFLAGVVGTQLDPDVAHTFQGHFGSLTRWGSALFFASTIAFSLPSFSGGGLFTPMALQKGALMTVAAVVGKMVPLMFLATPFTALNCLKFGVAMLGRGEFSFLIAAEAKAEEVVSEDDFSAAIWGAFLSSLIAPFLFRLIKRREAKTTFASGASGDTGGPCGEGDALSPVQLNVDVRGS
jgi:Kef-type K+ transport system membrane component KefB